jgi:4-amino-4-deoxy-L-arabinose transferase-like glycosyltransferase
VALAVHGISGKSGTSDEFIHVTGGFTYWKYGDFRFQPENGNWPQRIVAIPAVLSGAAFPTLQQEYWRTSNVWQLSEQFFFGGENDADRLLLGARLMVVAVASLLALLVFLWSRHIFGYVGGCVSLLLFVFTPDMLAHGALATSDVTATAFFLGATWALWTALHRPTWRTVIVSIVATAGLFLSKFSAVVFIPVALTMLAIRLVRRPRRIALLGGLTAAHCAGVMLIIWASFGFRYSAFRAEVVGGERFIDPWSEVTDASLPSRVIQSARRHEVFPEAYLFGMSHVLAYSRNRSAFLKGVVSQEGGWRWFFPYATLVKSTLPTLLLGCVVLVIVLRRVRSRDGHDLPVAAFDPYELLPLLSLIGWYWLFAILSRLNIGYRHMMPAAAALIVVAGASAQPVLAAIRAAKSQDGRVPRVA